MKRTKLKNRTALNLSKEPVAHFVDAKTKDGQRVKLPVNRAARRLVEKGNRARRNRRIAVLRRDLKVVRERLTHDTEFEERAAWIEAYNKGKQELKGLVGNDR